MPRSCIIFFACLVFLVACNETTDTSALLSVRGKYINVLKADNKFSNLYLKLSNDSIRIYKLETNAADVNIILFEEMEIKYREYKDPATGSVERIVEKVSPIYILK